MNSISKVNIRNYNVEELSKGEYLKIEAEKFLSMLGNDYIKVGYYPGMDCIFNYVSFWHFSLYENIG
ncbi:hypothetical protein BVG01_06905 [Bacillus anthracis]|nr:hypothetical protein BVG01_06905 [Bacillus anthracis]